MASGLQFPRPENAEAGLLTDADYQSSVYFKPQDTQKLVLSAKLNHRPGTVFEYKNSDPLVVASIMRYGLTQRGQDYATWPRRVLFDKLGARTLVMNVDAFGNFIGSGMVFASARDFARIGMLWLARGNWQEQQLWPDDWYEVLTRPSPANGWYGALVWLNQTDLYPDVPSDAFFFSGAFGQIVMVVPSRRLVVVRLGASERAFEIPVADNGRFSADSFADRFNTLMKMILAVVD
jgi:CubicO group peptidase (beta-lactamase class C family)